MDLAYLILQEMQRSGEIILIKINTLKEHKEHKNFDV